MILLMIQPRTRMTRKPTSSGTKVAMAFQALVNPCWIFIRFHPHGAPPEPGLRPRFARRNRDDTFSSRRLPVYGHTESPQSYYWTHKVILCKGVDGPWRTAYFFAGARVAGA